MWSKVKTYDKETRETFNICDIPKNFFEAATKETFKPAKKTLSIKVNLRFLIIKLLMLNYWPKQMEKLTAAVKIFLFT